jgi:hypothetical protein
LAPPFFLPPFFAALFFMAMVRSPVLEWNTRAIPRWIGGRPTVGPEPTADSLCARTARMNL